MAISKLTLGTVQFGMNYGIANTQGKPSFEKVVGILSVAYENGIRFLDTAAGYGDSEVVLGKALKELEDAGLVTRREYMEVPIRVEYETTPKCDELIPILEQLSDWCEKYWFKTIKPADKSQASR